VDSGSTGNGYLIMTHLDFGFSIFDLMDPRDLYGKPLLEGKCQGPTITVPMHGEFAAFVLLKNVRP
jgi:hypothetical protein